MSDSHMHGAHCQAVTNQPAAAWGLCCDSFQLQVFLDIGLFKSNRVES